MKKLFSFCTIGGLSLVASLVAAPRLLAVGDPTTYVYKQVGGLEIRADVYEPEGFSGPRPVLVWLHGGALMSGNRQGIQGAKSGPVRDAMLQAGVVVVVPDYRLAPETKLPEIIQDVEDSFAWVREKGPELFHIDPDRLVVAGSSAGGYLTLTMGYRLDPRPLALVSMWGYGDLIGDWYSTPSPHERHYRKGRYSAEQAYGYVSGPPVANKYERPGVGGGKFYEYCRQQGIWPQEVSGWNPHTEAEKFYPYMPLKNVTADYPPTLLIHGEKDTDVPFEQSVMMAEQFKKHGVEYQFISDPNADHGSYWSPEAKAKIDKAAVAFLLSHLK
ncbi:MAG: alpha/beta hydrolase [Opitutaceae bacterium]|nr:alpha/beta hydrolase [Cephaloticoccus sp.]MCP5530417.1 alpha/beta hydrolase [Opitutaceae bacterium]